MKQHSSTTGREKFAKTVKTFRTQFPEWRQKAALVAGITVFAAIGTILLMSSRAATPTAGFEAEAASRSGNASVISDASASGGGAVGFGSTALSAGCPPYPQFPDANCTGPTGMLAPYTGSQTFGTTGQVIENVIITTTGLTVSANNVTFRNCKITYTGAIDASFSMVDIRSGVTGTTFDHCELDGQGKVERTIAGTNGVTVRNCNIHDTGNGIEVDTNITMTDTYMHDIYTPAGQTWHADGVQSADSASDITIVHNTIFLTGEQVGAVDFVSNDGGGTYQNILVQNNLMAGGGFTVYIGTAPSRTINVKVVDNHFSTRYYPKVGLYGIWYGNYISNVVRTGNVIHETGASANDNI